MLNDRAIFMTQKFKKEVLSQVKGERVHSHLSPEWRVGIHIASGAEVLEI